MKTTLRNQLICQQHNPLLLEEKVMLAGLNIQLSFAKNVPNHVKAASKKSIRFWEKRVSSKRVYKLIVEMDKIDREGKTLGYYEDNLKIAKTKVPLIGLDSEDYNTVKSRSKTAELVDTISHELGHAFGLGHENSKGTIMTGVKDSARNVSRAQLATLKQNGFKILGQGNTTKKNGGKKNGGKKNGSKKKLVP
jgi:hypothetical protein